MRRARYFMLLALAVTPAALVLTVGGGSGESVRAATDVRKAQWEYRVMPEADLSKAGDPLTTLVSYAEKGAPSRAGGAVKDENLAQVVADAAVGVMKEKESKLNDMGTQGWELVAVADHAMFFRRNRN